MARHTLSLPHEGSLLPEASCVLPYAGYARKVVRLAQAVLDFATGADKRFLHEFDRSEWLGWQAEIRETFASVAARLR